MPMYDKGQPQSWTDTVGGFLLHLWLLLIGTKSERSATWLKNSLDQTWGVIFLYFLGISF